MSRWGVLGAAFVAGVLVAFAAVLIGLWSSLFHPPAHMPVDVSCPPDMPAVPQGKPLRVVMWNIQFGAGRAHHFFYEGGEAVSVPEDEVRANLDGIAAWLREARPDVVLLQEVDRRSKRTGKLDQHELLRAELDLPCHVSTPYFKVPYVPAPPGEHLGRVDMHLTALSRYRIDAATRHQLAMLQESAVKRQFNLKRALLELELPTEGGPPLVLLNTHLSAYALGDGTLERQLAQLDDALARIEGEGRPWVLAGDLNALPPGDDPARLGVDAKLYTTPSPLAPLFAKRASAVPLTELQADPEPWHTYLPHGAAGPDRTLDYVFTGGVAVHALGVRRDAGDLSDHTPVVLDFAVE